MKSLMLSATLLVLMLGCNDKSQPPEQSSNAATPSTGPAATQASAVQKSVMLSASGGSNAPTSAPAATQASDTQKPINKYCAVNRDEEIDPTVTTVYNGKVIGFCCDDCIPKFKKDPEKYMKDLK